MKRMLLALTLAGCANFAQPTAAYITRAWDGDKFLRCEVNLGWKESELFERCGKPLFTSTRQPTGELCHAYPTLESGYGLAASSRLAGYFVCMGSVKYPTTSMTDLGRSMGGEARVHGVYGVIALDEAGLTARHASSPPAAAPN